MVSYQKWTSLVFETHPDAEATAVISAAAAEWQDRKQALQEASVSDARDHARTL
jgi:hypothetical protein